MLIFIKTAPAFWSWGQVLSLGSCFMTRCHALDLGPRGPVNVIDMFQSLLETLLI